MPIEMPGFSVMPSFTNGTLLMARKIWSATSHAASTSKSGKAAVRAALYFPAIVAKQHNPLVQALCARLTARGLCPKAVIGAAMRKLVTIAYGVLKSGQPFDPQYGQAVTGQA